MGDTLNPTLRIGMEENVLQLSLLLGRGYGSTRLVPRVLYLDWLVNKEGLEHRTSIHRPITPVTRGTIIVTCPCLFHSP